MTSHPSEDLRVLLTRIEDFLGTEVYPLEQDFLRRPFSDLVPIEKQLRTSPRASGAK